MRTHDCAETATHNTGMTAREDLPAHYKRRSMIVIELDVGGVRSRFAILLVACYPLPNVANEIDHCREKFETHDAFSTNS